MAPALLILLGVTAIRQVDSLPNEKFLLLPPVNFTIKVTGLAQVLLRWEPNPHQGPSKVKLGYRVKMTLPEEDEYETRGTESERVTVLHQGLAVSVQTIWWDGHARPGSRWVPAWLEAPPGSPGTSAVNLTCTTNTVANGSASLGPYHVSLHCTWLFGKEAPEDTQYFLYYRYGARTEECQHYSHDTQKRSSACWFPSTSIEARGHGWLAVRVSGSSQHAAIRPLDRLFALHAIDQVNPPVNVTAERAGTRLSIQWEKPVSAFPTHCFDYEVKIDNPGEGYCQTEKTTTHEFTSTVSDISKYSIQVRAAVSFVCRAGGLWSDWSPPIYVGNDEQKPWTEWFLVVLSATLCCLLVLLCRTCHLWTKLFPPVPAPKSNIRDFAASINYEKSGSGETDIEVISYVDEPGLEVLEDCVF